MYSLKQLVISGRKRRWILMDLETSLPLLYPLRYHIDHLAFRSLSTQSASLQSVKFFYEFWRQKYGVSFCYSFYSSDHNPDIAVGEMPAFWMYLENGHNVQSNVLSLTRVTKANSLTHTVRVRAVIHFISFLINTYISPAYRDDSPKALSLLASRLHTRLQLCRENYRTLTSNKFSQHSHSSQGFQSLSGAMVLSLYGIITPSSAQKHNPLNPFPSGHLQFRNFLIIRLLLNYGLRTGEILLLECSSIKPNLKGDKFSLIVTTVDEAYEPRKNAPSLKNAWANRVLELDKQDYIFLSIYIAKLRPKTDKHDFIFTSSQQSAKPLSYTSVHSIFSKFENSGWDHVVNGIEAYSVNLNQNFVRTDGRIIYVIKSQLRRFTIAFKRKRFHRLRIHLLFILSIFRVPILLSKKAVPSSSSINTAKRICPLTCPLYHSNRPDTANMKDIVLMPVARAYRVGEGSAFLAKTHIAPVPAKNAAERRPSTSVPGVLSIPHKARSCSGKIIHTAARMKNNTDARIASRENFIFILSHQAEDYFSLPYPGFLRARI